MDTQRAEARSLLRKLGVGLALVAGAVAVIGLGARWAREAREARARGLLDLTPEAHGLARKEHPESGMTFVLIEQGSFQMGSPQGEEGQRGGETLHRVTLTEPFYLGETEVTQAQWKRVMGGDNPSRFGGDEQPVEQVSWVEAREFCSRLTEKGRNVTYRLPTEAEWEYACRAGSTTRFYSGDAEADLASVGWYGANSGGYTHEVKTRSPNAWGLYDMHGNVWEWCEDWYGDYPIGQVTDPSGPSTGSLRVIRGGGRYFDPRFCRSAVRFRVAPGHRDGGLGFRVLAVPAAGK